MKRKLIEYFYFWIDHIFGSIFHYLISEGCHGQTDGCHGQKDGCHGQTDGRKNTTIFII